MKMGCLKRPSKFLFIKYNKPHIWEIERAGKFMPRVGDKFIVQYKCTCCGLFKIEHFVSGESLMRVGYSAEKIEELQTTTF